MSEQLLPCPFCTSNTVQCCFGLGATYLVECQSCQTSGPRAMNQATAISAWNTRTDADEITRAKAAILDRCGDHVECLSRREIMDLAK